MTATTNESWFSLQLGTQQLADAPTDFLVNEELLHQHMAIFGGTRYGKSKLFELVCRQLITHGCGLAWIDPHSDTADDLLAYLACHRKELAYLCDRVYYLNPVEQLFSFDPFLYHPEPNDARSYSELAYQSWLHKKTKHMARIIVRKQGETEAEQSKTVRLRRWLTTALYAVGHRQDEQGTHQRLTDVLVLLRPQHPRHEEVFQKVAPFLDGKFAEEFLSDLEMLRATKNARQQEDWVESAINRLRDTFSPVVTAVFSQTAPSIDFHKIIREGGIILASLGPREQPIAFDIEEGNVLAGLIIREIQDAVMTVRREERKRYYLFMDEAQSFLNEDFLHLLKESAKYKLSVGLAVQALDNLQKGEIDLVPAVLGQCGIRITFRQQFHEHAEILAKNLCYPLLDFEELVHGVERDAGYEFVLMPSISAGEGENEGTVETFSTMNQMQETKSTGAKRTIQQSKGVSIPGSSMQLTQSMAFGTNEMSGTGATAGNAASNASSKGTSKTRSVTLALTPLHKTQLEYQKTGRLKLGVSDQVAQHTHKLQSLPKQHCLVAVAQFNLALLLRITDVVDPFEEQYASAQWRTEQIEALKVAMTERHDCFFDIGDNGSLGTTQDDANFENTSSNRTASQFDVE